MKIIRFVLGPIPNNTYAVIDEKSKNGFVVDPSFSPGPVIDYLLKEHIQIKAVLITHGHIDHFAGLSDITEHWKVPCYIGAGDEEALRNPAVNLSENFSIPFASDYPVVKVYDGDSIHAGDFSLEVIETPGHTKGGVSWYMKKEGVLFTGDSLFKGSVGRTDLPGGNWKNLIHSLREKILILPDNTEVYPGHGEITSIGEEKTGNPFLQGDL